MNHTRRCRVLVIDKKQILLVRGWLGSQRWSLPGGGIKKGEDAIQAAARELTEETGLSLTPDKFAVLATQAYPDASRGLNFPITYLLAQLENQTPRSRRRLEIIDIGWFSMDNLPLDTSDVVFDGLKLLNKEA